MFSFQIAFEIEISGDNTVNLKPDLEKYNL